MKIITSQQIVDAQKILEEAQEQDRIEKRESEKQKRIASKPTPLENPDIDRLKRAAQEYVDKIAAGEYIDEDTDHYIFEAAIVAFYGQSVWKWINEFQNGG